MALRVGVGGFVVETRERARAAGQRGLNPDPSRSLDATVASASRPRRVSMPASGRSRLSCLLLVLSPKLVLSLIASESRQSPHRSTAASESVTARSTSALDALTRQSPAPMIVDVVCILVIRGIEVAAYLVSTRLMGEQPSNRSGCSRGRKPSPQRDRSTGLILEAGACL